MQVTKSYVHDLDHIDQSSHDAKSGTVFNTASGIKYENSLKRGYVHGKAAIQFPDTTCFDGFCKQNALTGLGVVSYSTMRYCGDLVNGQHHGNGILEVPGGGPKYEGTVRFPVECPFGSLPASEPLSTAEPF